MVANLRAGNIDGYLGPDPFNQRAVYDEVGFIHILSKEIWDGHPCCSFGVPTEFVKENPNTFAALYRAMLTAAAMARDPKNRPIMAEVLSPANYLNQPKAVLEQVLTGKFADGLGNVKNVPDRVDFDPFPWYSMAVWILSQMKRWGYIKGDVKYKDIAEKVYLLTDARKRMAEVGMTRAEGEREEVQGHGQGVRPGQGRRLRRQLRHQEDLRRARCVPKPSRRRCISLLLFLLFIGAWQLATLPKESAAAVRRRRRRVCRADGQGRARSRAAFRRRRRWARPLSQYLSDPFYDKGPNDKGIGIQLGHSLARVGLGFLLAVMVALPLGFVIGMSPLLYQGLRSLHPGAEADFAAGLDAARALHPEGLVDLRHLRHLHLLDLADADQHRLRRGLGAPRLAQRRAHAGGESAAQGLPGDPAGRGADHPDRHAHLDGHRLAGDRRRRDAGRRYRHRLLRLERVEQPRAAQRDLRHGDDRPGRHGAGPDLRPAAEAGHLPRIGKKLMSTHFLSIEA